MEVLPDRGCNNDSYETQSAYHYGMSRRHLKDVLEEEGIELGDLPKDDQLADGKEAHVGTVGVEPAHVGPVLWCELQHRTLDLTRRGVYVPGIRVH